MRCMMFCEICREFPKPSAARCLPRTGFCIVADKSQQWRVEVCYGQVARDSCGRRTMNVIDVSNAALTWHVVGSSTVAPSRAHRKALYLPAGHATGIRCLPRASIAVNSCGLLWGCCWWLMSVMNIEQAKNWAKTRSRVPRSM
jgi:hypothetical protein